MQCDKWWDRTRVLKMSISLGRLSKCFSNIYCWYFDKHFLVLSSCVFIITRENVVQSRQYIFNIYFRYHSAILYQQTTL
jgi:hypothetical protein